MTSVEFTVDCPFCGETFSTVVDPSEENQTYVEDCYVCCRPILFHVTCHDGAVENVVLERDL